MRYRVSFFKNLLCLDGSASRCLRQSIVIPELDVPEDRYRDRGYQPPLDQLPWKDDGVNDNS